MYIHSVPVPRLYKEASKLLRNVRENGLGLKEGLFQRKHPNLKAIYALVAETIKHFSQINELIEKTNLSEKEPKLNLWMARILIFEVLWNNRELKGDCKPFKTILSFRDELMKHKKDLQVPASDVRVNKPRFVRVNTLKLTMEDAVNGFRDEGWNFVRFTNTNYEAFLSRVASLNSDEFMVDMHIKELLIFPTRTEFFTHQTYKDKLIVLQDKASCLPVHLLNPSPNSVVLDMCAAPGMKTSYLAALLKNEGVIYAVELDRRRFDLLNASLEGTEATCIKTINKDALTVTAEDCPNVEYILVDPSCSGSGMTNRVLLDDKENANNERLKTLAGFQIIILKHALTHFPQAKRVVYSTCSIYREENEEVVEEVLMQCKNFKLVSAKHLLNNADNFEPQEEESVSDKCINFNSQNDLTNGFFIAVFERVENQPGGEEEPGDSNRNVKVNKKRKRRNEDDSQVNQVESNLEKQIEDEEIGQSNRLQASEPKKKKYKKASAEVQAAVVTELTPPKRKNQINEENKDIDEDNCLQESKPKKKKKRKNEKDNIEVEQSKEVVEANQSKSKSKKKQKFKVEDSLPEEHEQKFDDCHESDHKSNKKNKKYKKEKIINEEETIIHEKKHKQKIGEASLPEEQEREVDDFVQESDHKSKKNKRNKKEKIVCENKHKQKIGETVSSEEPAETEEPRKKKKKKHNI